MLDTKFSQDDPDNPSAGVLELTGTATIEHGAQLREALLDALERANSLVVDVGGITEVDVAALQLFCAARRSAIGRQKEMVLADGVPDAFTAAVLATGFNRTHTASCWLTAGQACLWGNCGQPGGREVRS